MMLRILALLLLLFAAFWLIRRAMLAIRRGPASDREPTVAHMVKCAHCGTYVPERGAVSGNGETYCSTEHRGLGARDNPE